MHSPSVADRNTSGSRTPLRRVTAPLGVDLWELVSDDPTGSVYVQFIPCDLPSLADALEAISPHPYFPSGAEAREINGRPALRFPVGPGVALSRLADGRQGAPPLPPRAVVDIVAWLSDAVALAWAERALLLRYDARPSALRVSPDGRLYFQNFVSGLGEQEEDLYQLGVTLFELAARRRFGRTAQSESAHRQHVERRLDAVDWSAWGASADDARSLVRALTAYDASARPDPMSVALQCRELGYALGGGDLAGWAVTGVPALGKRESTRTDAEPEAEEPERAEPAPRARRARDAGREAEARDVRSYDLETIAGVVDRPAQGEMDLLPMEDTGEEELPVPQLSGGTAFTLSVDTPAAPAAPPPRVVDERVRQRDPLASLYAERPAPRASTPLAPPPVVVQPPLPAAPPPLPAAPSPLVSEWSGSPMSEEDELSEPEAPAPDLATALDAPTPSRIAAPTALGIAAAIAHASAQNRQEPPAEGPAEDLAGGPAALSREPAALSPEPASVRAHAPIRPAEPHVGLADANSLDPTPAPVPWPLEPADPVATAVVVVAEAGDEAPAAMGGTAASPPEATAAPLPADAQDAPEPVTTTSDLHSLAEEPVFVAPREPDEPTQDARAQDPRGPARTGRRTPRTLGGRSPEEPSLPGAYATPVGESGLADPPPTAPRPVAPDPSDPALLARATARPARPTTPRGVTGTLPDPVDPDAALPPPPEIRAVTRPAADPSPRATVVRAPSATPEIWFDGSERPAPPLVDGTPEPSRTGWYVGAAALVGLVALALWFAAPGGDRAPGPTAGPAANAPAASVSTDLPAGPPTDGSSPATGTQVAPTPPPVEAPLAPEAGTPPAAPQAATSTPPRPSEPGTTPPPLTTAPPSASALVAPSTAATAAVRDAAVQEASDNAVRIPPSATRTTEPTTWTGDSPWGTAVPSPSSPAASPVTPPSSAGSTSRTAAPESNPWGTPVPVTPARTATPAPTATPAATPAPAASATRTTAPTATPAPAPKPATTPTKAPLDEPPSRTKAPSGAPIYINISSKPGGASVTVDGVPSGTSPLGVWLPPGSHTVSFSRNGDDKTVTMLVAPGGDTSWVWNVSTDSVQ